MKTGLEPASQDRRLGDDESVGSDVIKLNSVKVTLGSRPVFDSLLWRMTVDLIAINRIRIHSNRTSNYKPEMQEEIFFHWSKSTTACLVLNWLPLKFHSQKLTSTPQESSLQDGQTRGVFLLELLLNIEQNSKSASVIIVIHSDIGCR